MRAAQITRHGGKDVMHIASDAPRPQAGASQVLVEVYAASVNPFDWKIREGNMPLHFPATLGGDFAGIVAETGEDVSGLEVGQEVYGQANAMSGQGSWADFAPVKATALAPKPRSVDFVTAAAIPLAAISAYQALVDTLHVSSGQKILIHGGAGGIGTFAVQLAKHLGAHVATTAASEDIAYVKQLGADEAIDYKAQKFEDIVHDYDAVYDTIGGDTYTRSFEVLKTGGSIVSMLEQPNEALATNKHVTALYQGTHMDQEKLNKVAELVDQGTLKVTIDKVFPLEEAAEALEYVKTSHHRGKVVLRVKEEDSQRPVESN